MCEPITMEKAPKVAAALLPAVFLFLPAAAGEAAAGPSAIVPLELRLDVPQPIVRRTLSRAELGELRGMGESDGLTRLTLKVSYVISSVFWPPPEPSFRVTRLEVAVGYEAIAIYVAREYREGSCAYERILEHEREHVRADRRLVAAYAKQLEAALRALEFPTEKKPWEVSSSAIGRQRAEAEVRKAIQALEPELTRAREAASRELDRDKRWQAALADCQRH